MATNRDSLIIWATDDQELLYDVGYPPEFHLELKPRKISFCNWVITDDKDEIFPDLGFRGVIRGIYRHIGDQVWTRGRTGPVLKNQSRQIYQNFRVTYI